VVHTYVQQLQTPYGMSSLVADSALYSAANLQKLADTAMKWISRVPATLSEAQAALAQVAPQALAPLTEGYSYHEFTSTYGGIAQRWLLIASEPRQPQAQRSVDKQWRTQSDKEGKVLKKLCSTTFACDADARLALAAFEQTLQEHDATFPDQKGKPVQNPTARWVFQYFVGIHVLRIPEQWDPLVVNLTEEHQSLLRLLGKPYERLYR